MERVEGHDVHVSGYTGRPGEVGIDASSGAVRGERHDLRPAR